MDAIEKFLLECGYKIDRNAPTISTNLHASFYKHLDRDDAPLCELNRKLTVYINWYDNRAYGSQSQSFTMGIQAQVNDLNEEWCSLDLYGLRFSQLKSNHDQYIEKLVKSWTAINS